MQGEEAELDQQLCCQAFCVTWCRAGSAQPVAYDTPYESDGDTPPEGHHHHQVCYVSSSV